MTKPTDSRAEEQARHLMLVFPQVVAGFKSLIGEGQKGDSLTPHVVSGRPGPRHVAAMTSLALLGPASVSDLAARMNLTLTHASQIVGELATSGLVERREDENDRRRTIASLSPRGRERLEAVTVDVMRPLTAFCRALGEREASRFADQLTSLVSLLGPATDHPVGRVGGRSRTAGRP